MWQLMAWKNYGFGRNVKEDVCRRTDYICNTTTRFLASDNWTDITASKCLLPYDADQAARHEY
jgi:hypothetical protein